MLNLKFFKSIHRLGNQKRRSKHAVEVTHRPEWLEQFDFYLYEGSGQTTMFEIDFLEDAAAGRIPLGSTCLDISQMEKDKTTEVFLNFTNGLGQARMALTISGFRPTSTECLLQSNSESILAQYVSKF